MTTTLPVGDDDDDDDDDDGVAKTKKKTSTILYKTRDGRQFSMDVDGVSRSFWH